MTDDPAALAPWRGADGRFSPGNPGRRPGSRNSVSTRVSEAILRDFEAHQDELLERLRAWFLPQYVQLVARLLPRQIEVAAPSSEALDDAEVLRLLADADAVIERLTAAGALPSPQAPLSDPPAPAVNYGDLR